MICDELQAGAVRAVQDVWIVVAIEGLMNWKLRAVLRKTIVKRKRRKTQNLRHQNQNQEMERAENTDSLDSASKDEGYDGIADRFKEMTNERDELKKMKMNQRSAYD